LERRTGVIDALFSHFGFEVLFDFESSLDERGESNDVRDGEGEGVLLALISMGEGRGPVAAGRSAARVAMNNGEMPSDVSLREKVSAPVSSSTREQSVLTKGQPPVLQRL